MSYFLILVLIGALVSVGLSVWASARRRPADAGSETPDTQKPDPQKFVPGSNRFERGDDPGYASSPDPSGKPDRITDTSVKPPAPGDGARTPASPHRADGSPVPGSAEQRHQHGKP